MSKKQLLDEILQDAFQDWLDVIIGVSVADFVYRWPERRYFTLYDDEMSNPYREAGVHPERCPECGHSWWLHDRRNPPGRTKKEHCHVAVSERDGRPAHSCPCSRVRSEPEEE